MGKDAGDGGAAKAATAQTQAAQQAAATAQANYKNAQAALDPYEKLGTAYGIPNLLATTFGSDLKSHVGPDIQKAEGYVNQLGGMNPNLSVDYSSIMADPMYQFARDAALEQNARRARAMGLGNSSVRANWDADTAMKAALQARDRIYGQNVDNYNRGYRQLADQAQLHSELGNQGYGRILNLVNLGLGATGGSNTAGQNYSNALTGIKTNEASQLGNIYGQEAQVNAQNSAQNSGILGTIGGGIGTIYGGTGGGMLGTGIGSALGSIF